ncbi:hypothetical protein SLEP1_g52893 [Rubroshorea leprosula]|uniref:Dof zinc finger protein n=1 Tax=Rubroshorea leprosula TaxID=152421 RepID=A0AAV5M7Q0_9ROSI|nr:hypothetical protein SLEP1_g52893 [Rubroshorea leprosula]
MGLSSKEVSGDGGLGWSQALLQAQTLELPKPSVKRQQQNQSEQLKCPRCDSTNTKFCYYNNYNKSQPRHFCKACKRHWTKGGTLRNVPVGGGRKNKRLKTSNSGGGGGGGGATSGASTSTVADISKRGSSQFQEQRQRQEKHDYLPSALGDLKNIYDFNHPVLTCPLPSLVPGNRVFLGSTSTLSLPQNQALHFPFSTSSSSSFDTNPSSISTSFQSQNVYEPMEDPTIASITMPATSTTVTQPPWQTPCATSAAMEMTNYWNWDEIDALVSTDINIPWDDSEIKP